MKRVIPDDTIKLDDKYVKEMLRFSDSKVHTVAAFLGGVASQEAIKILIKQYTPMNHTFVYDGINGRCQVFNI
jgi:amyloid beta precursor protein binding protein 1